LIHVLPLMRMEGWNWKVLERGRREIELIMRMFHIRLCDTLELISIWW
jgi:hypothetical protein